MNSLEYAKVCSSMATLEDFMPASNEDLDPKDQPTFSDSEGQPDFPDSEGQPDFPDSEGQPDFPDSEGQPDFPDSGRPEKKA
jgi:hypothetical protein